MADSATKLIYPNIIWLPRHAAFTDTDGFNSDTDAFSAGERRNVVFW
jgi:hypothetical protein